MALLGSTMKSAPKMGWSLFGIIKKYWYWIILILVTLPSIIDSIQIATETENPTYPFFDLASRILVADASLDKTVNLLREDVDAVVGMPQPESGIWNGMKYNWFWFWRVFFRIWGDVWLIFFPLILIYKLVHNLGNHSVPAHNFFRATKYFLIYLFVTNAIIFIHGLIIGNNYVSIPEGADKFGAYFFLFVKLLPFHGLFNLVSYIITSIF